MSVVAVASVVASVVVPVLAVVVTMPVPFPSVVAVVVASVAASVAAAVEPLSVVPAVVSFSGPQARIRAPVAARAQGRSEIMRAPYHVGDAPGTDYAYPWAWRRNIAA